VHLELCEEKTGKKLAVFIGGKKRDGKDVSNRSIGFNGGEGGQDG